MEVSGAQYALDQRYAAAAITRRAQSADKGAGQTGMEISTMRTLANLIPIRDASN
jgi:hypothetical protein